MRHLRTARVIARFAIPTALAACSSTSTTAPGGPADMNLVPSKGGATSMSTGTSASGGTVATPLTGGTTSTIATGGTTSAPPLTTPPNRGGAPGVPPGVGGSPPIGAGGANVGGTPVTGAAGVPVNTPNGCAGETMPAVTGDYAANGPMTTMVVNGTGSDGNFTVYRPVMLGQNGFLHPIATWGNGITTTPAYYPGLLSAIASHGFVVIASNSSNVTAQLMTDGLDWMIAQNAAAGEYRGKLDTTCLVTIGYSLGGGASVGAGAHANVVATASMHGVTGPSNMLHAPLLLLTSETDSFVVPSTFVTPTFNLSSVQTFYGTLSMAADTGNAGHLIPVDLLPSSANMLERAAMIAWLRLWVYDDQGARKYFFGDDCVLCKAPWSMPQRKNWK